MPDNLKSSRKSWSESLQQTTIRILKRLLPNYFKHSIKKLLLSNLLTTGSDVHTLDDKLSNSASPLAGSELGPESDQLHLSASKTEPRIAAPNWFDKLASRPDLPMSNLPTYAQDSLISWHNVEFLEDPSFKRAYELGAATASWHGYDIHWRIHILCWAAHRATQLAGDFVECGVNLGGFSRAVIHYVDFGSLPKTFYLMDTFNGLVDKYISDEEKMAGIVKVYGNYYTECFQRVTETFRPFNNVKLIRGAIPDTLTQVTSSKICYLSIDMNCTMPEIAAAEYFWDKLVSGAVIVLDDYGHYLHRMQKHAFDEFAAHRGVQILMLPTGQGLLFKP